MDLKIDVTPAGINVKAPYHANFVSAARKIEGRWDKPFWKFPIQSEAAVRKLCAKFFGLAENGMVDLATVEITYPAIRAFGRRLSEFGKDVATCEGKHLGVQMSYDVDILEGAFQSGGSHKYWHVETTGHTKIHMHKIPRHLAEDAVKKDPARYRIIDAMEVIENA